MPGTARGRVTEREPGYTPLPEKMRSTIVPGNIKDLIRECHTSMRNNINQVSGSIELAYRRGLAEGLSQAKKKPPVPPQSRILREGNDRTSR